MYGQNDLYDKALEYFYKTYAICEELDLKIHKGNVLSNISNQ